jgi:hypothetical protein
LNITNAGVECQTERTGGDKGGFQTADAEKGWFTLNHPFPLEIIDPTPRRSRRGKKFERS